MEGRNNIGLASAVTWWGKSSQQGFSPRRWSS